MLVLLFHVKMSGMVKLIYLFRKVKELSAKERVLTLLDKMVTFLWNVVRKLESMKRNALSSS